MRRAGAGAAAAFARGVVRRYAAQAAAHRPIGKVYRRLAAPSVVVRRPVQVRLAPTLNFTLVDRASPGAPMVLRREAAFLGTEMRSRSSAGRLERILARQETRFVERLLAREERIVVQTSPAALVRSLVASESAPGMARRGAAVIVPPVERVLRRPAAAVEARVEGSTADGWGAPIGVRRAAPRAELGTAELDRLTEHVMRTLDRRVAAHRERHGRR